MELERTCLVSLLLLVLCVHDVTSCTLYTSDPAVRHDVISSITEKLNILEVEFQLPGNVQTELERRGGDWWFQPARWYVTYQPSRERLLLLYQYYYGLLRSLLSVDRLFFKVPVRLDPPNCLLALNTTEILDIFRIFLLNQLESPPSSNRSAILSGLPETTHVCSANVKADGFWGQLVYDCCHGGNAGTLQCSDVENDGWVWALNILIIVFTIVLFLYFPTFVPTRYSTRAFIFRPAKEQQLNVVVTQTPNRHTRDGKNVIPMSRFRSLKKMAAHLDLMNEDTVYTVNVTRISFLTEMDRLLEEGVTPVTLSRLLYDGLVRCKVRHYDAVEPCCDSAVCGCPRVCPYPWHACLRKLRTLLVFAVLVLPALPILYAQMADGLDYTKVQAMMTRRGLLSSENFYMGPVLGKVVPAFLLLLYLLHAALILVDSGLNANREKLYSELLKNSTVDMGLRDRLDRVGWLIRLSLTPLRKCGVWTLPLWLLMLFLMPAIVVVYFVFDSPVFRIAIHIVKTLRQTAAETDVGGESRRMRTGGMCVTVLFVISMLAMFLVLSLDVSFLLRVLCLMVVNFLLSLDTALVVLPVVLALFMYIRNTLQGVYDLYATYQQTLLTKLIELETEEIAAVARLSSNEQENRAFVIKSDEENGELDDFDTNFLKQGQKSKKGLFSVKNGELRMRVTSLVFFLDKRDVPYISKKFFQSLTTLQVSGCPGYLSEVLLRAFLDLCKIMVFLLFVLIVVFAYGDTQYVSSGIQFIITFVVGIVPLLLRYMFKPSTGVPSLDPESLSFKSQFAEKTNAFSQTWQVQDINLSDVPFSPFFVHKSRPNGVTSPDNNGRAVTTWTMTAKQDQPTTIDLIVDVSGRPGTKERKFSWKNGTVCDYSIQHV